VYAEFKECPLVSISYSQRSPCPFAHWHANVYHGLPQDMYAFHPQPGQYLAFIGRLSPEKRPDQAVRIAERVGLSLRIAAKVDPVDREYVEGVMKPLLSHPLVEYVGEITDAEKDAFLGEAMAVLCPYQPEPFGLALIEALACGTPVITYGHGSFPEMIDDGRTGFLCRDVDDMVAALRTCPRLTGATADPRSNNASPSNAWLRSMYGSMMNCCTTSKCRRMWRAIVHEPIYQSRSGLVFRVISMTRR
jgi:glycosyltransferase involved in cell wall biosynthesis